MSDYEADDPRDADVVDPNDAPEPVKPSTTGVAATSDGKGGEQEDEFPAAAI